MGRGITSINHADPLDEWQLRIANFGSPALSDALRRLFRGDRVESVDGALEISARATTRPDAHTLTVLQPDAPFVADVVVRAVPLADAGTDGDERESFPGPDGWQNVQSDEKSLWELFNCVVHSVTSRTRA